MKASHTDSRGPACPLFMDWERTRSESQPAQCSHFCIPSCYLNLDSPRGNHRKCRVPDYNPKSWSIPRLVCRCQRVFLRRGTTFNHCYSRDLESNLCLWSKNQAKIGLHISRGLCCKGLMSIDSWIHTVDLVSYPHKHCMGQTCTCWVFRDRLCQRDTLSNARFQSSLASDQVCSTDPSPLVSDPSTETSSIAFQLPTNT